MIIKVHEAESGNDTLIDKPAGEIFSQAAEAMEGSYAQLADDKEVEFHIGPAVQKMYARDAEKFIKKFFDSLIGLSQKMEGFKLIEIDSAEGDHVEIIL